MGIYNEPRELLENVISLLQVKSEKVDALCCGGSLGGLATNKDSRKIITKDALSILTKNDPDMIITGCPLCKKTFSGSTEKEIKDISEVIAASLKPYQAKYTLAGRN